MKTGLVLEGGSRQTMFSAGVIDTWLEEGGIDFNYVAGVSAGAHAAVNFITRQQGRLSLLEFKRNFTRSTISLPTVKCRWILMPTAILELNLK